ncbi:hypothetical protein DPM19_14420 [Actinomadura craniellae]|uniref:CU044_5270 family protein n=1 Tax=Actinomadura craniellae TaxID=2231787 RepID=A0A365H738_9ACTN|nr:CU044_5270 family protein [Actinomadura craniellae]RAY14897.1 hypothetical protein DPM19_14420 [Actinomadura craniellae]
MDDLAMVRELYGETPADPELRERVRVRLTEPARPRRRVKATFGLGLAAAATAAALAGGTLLSGGAPAAPPRETTAAQPMDARTVLLAAADNAAREKPGRYWRLHTTGGQSYRVDGYTIEGYRWETDAWTARSTDEPDLYFDRDLPTRPLTAADAAAWRAAGSPTTWRVSSNGDPRVLTTRSTGWRYGRATPGKKKRIREDMRKACAGSRLKDAPQCVSPQEADRFAADPARLKEMLAARPPRGLEGEAARVDMLRIFTFLTDKPATPAVRAAAFRLLVETPGIRLVGPVRDAAGRPGVALAARGTMREGSGTVYDQQIILDPKTYRILGEQRVVVRAGGSMAGMSPGTVLSRTLVHRVGWTDERPRHP